MVRLLRYDLVVMGSILKIVVLLVEFRVFTFTLELFKEGICS